MSRPAFLRNWAIKSSNTTFLAVGNRLKIKPDSDKDKVRFECSGDSPDRAKSWAGVDDCHWYQRGGKEGFLCGTIKDDSGDSYPFVATYRKITKPNPGDVNLIHLEIVGPPVGPPGSATMDGGGGAGGDDET